MVPAAKVTIPTFLIAFEREIFLCWSFDSGIEMDVFFVMFLLFV